MGNWRNVFFVQPVFEETHGCVGSPAWRTVFHYDTVARLAFVLCILPLFCFTPAAGRLRFAGLYVLNLAVVVAVHFLASFVPDPSGCGPDNFPAGHLMFHISACSFFFAARRPWLGWGYVVVSACILVSTCLGAYHSVFQLLAGALAGIVAATAHRWVERIPWWTFAALAVWMLESAVSLDFRYPFERWNLGAMAVYVLYRIIKSK